ncbi:peptidoglycan DD-metalloendopeptidase family protein [Effusibacillus consociatus]|uniref:Peptidoglycan DD-metalloendopeptidase family protein n=1 Tax=Effusibacillus consociatus TaxID=1117041 RepID=A0ABV9Q2H4_9BACL
MRKKQIWKPFTIMLVPHSGEQVRSMSVSKAVIASFAAVIFALGAGGGYFLYKFSEYRQSTNEFNSYKQQTEQIRNEYNSLAGTAEAVKQKLDTLQQLENDLRSKNGLPPVNPAQNNTDGQGGVLQSRGGLIRQHMILNKDAVFTLEQEADQRIHSAQETIATVNEKDAQKQAEERRKQEQAAHTPSIWPTGSRNITSDFGYRKDPFGGFYTLHTGLDISGSHGSTIVSTADGIVTVAGWDGGYGISVVIDHRNGILTRYGHLSAVSVKAGQAVKKGDSIGQMGSTGRSTGTHLHYEVLENGVPVSPLKYLP